ncbi:hypothetical protein B0H17DRAFT_108593 [Mycena rosella]|uniref:Uncharacterized protein n=1 Tax=Mycena rosella TaxID=1033263 RepID=A0AAD7AX98_MYCRO|nr:hypothetical protein B0H17DRAFT_108593 [Mycena rosella]
MRGRAASRSTLRAFAAGGRCSTVRVCGRRAWMTCLVCLAVSDWFLYLYFMFVSLLLSLPFVFISLHCAGPLHMSTVFAFVFRYLLRFVFPHQRQSVAFDLAMITFLRPPSRCRQLPPFSLYSPT